MPRLTRVKCVGRLLSRWELMLCFDFGSVRACTRSKTRREGGQLTRALARAKKGAPAIYVPPGTPSSRINFSPILPEIDLTPDETRSGGGGRGGKKDGGPAKTSSLSSFTGERRKCARHLFRREGDLEHTLAPRRVQWNVALLCPRCIRGSYVRDGTRKRARFRRSDFEITHTRRHE